MTNLYLLLPGNPSVPGVYDSFLNSVVETHARAGESFKYVLPHLGQCNQNKFKGKHVSIRNVFDDHLLTIQALISQHKATNVYLIGHSFGSAVTIELYEELKEQVTKFVVLCPFLGASDNSIRYLKMFKNPISRLGMQAASYSILANQKFSESFFRRWLGDNPYNSHIPREIKKPRYIKNFFSLVSEYIEVFPKLELQKKLSKMDPIHSFFLFAENDYWVPSKTRDYLPENAFYEVNEHISHDFCLKIDEYQKVAASISDFLERV